MSVTIFKRPVDASGYAKSRYNALRHGLLSRHVVLPCEDRADYDALLASLIAEHSPQGPTEEHLVEELAGIMWRKPRLRQAEASTYRRALYDTTGPFAATSQVALVLSKIAAFAGSVDDAIRNTPEQTADELKELDGRAQSILAAQTILHAGKRNYGAAVDALDDETREQWEDMQDPGSRAARQTNKHYSADAAGLREFLEDMYLIVLRQRRWALENREYIREQALGESFNASEMEALARYEVHLDRKLERVLGLLFKLKELRQPKALTT